MLRTCLSDALVKMFCPVSSAAWGRELRGVKNRYIPIAPFIHQTEKKITALL